jgi:prepilin-type N-terminal cleavage/methylation domain-containing protein
MNMNNETLPIADCRLPITKQGAAVCRGSIGNRQPGSRQTADFETFPISDFRFPIAKQDAPVRFRSIGNRQSAIGNVSGFTLIELLTVIAIMALIAAMIFPVAGAVKKHQYISTATGELKQIQNWLEDYKAKYGTYPPGNALPPSTYTLPQHYSMFSPLYYELSGVTITNTAAGTVFTTLDHGAQISSANASTAFGLGGFINCSKGVGEDASPARDYMLGLKANQICSVQSAGINISNLVTTVQGPDTSYNPLNFPTTSPYGSGPYPNPFRYICPGTNNPSSYDLWIQLSISHKMYLICNWSSAVQVNNPAP